MIVGALVLIVLLLSVLVAGLLRSHATILRRLHQLGAGIDIDPGAAAVDPGAPTAGTGGAAPGRVVPRTDGTVPAPDATVPDGRMAVDVSGVGPRGEAIATRVVGVSHDTLLVFLSSGCTSCLAFWNDLGTRPLPLGTRLIVVTRGPEHESPAAVQELAPTGVTVIMSTPAHDDLRVPGSPFVVLVDGPSGRVVGEGTATSYEQVLALFLRAGDDASSEPGGKAAADRRREAKLDRLLLDAGIAPGDPSLYQSPGAPLGDGDLHDHDRDDHHDHDGFIAPLAADAQAPAQRPDAAGPR